METASGVTIAWAPHGELTAALCRNCGAAGEKPRLLRASAALPGQKELCISLLDCPACGCAFAETVPPYDYEGRPAHQLSIDLYAEAAAGIWPIVRPLARLTAPEGTHYLEIGCGFGFGLDFAIRARGWLGRGIDPSPLARAGRVQLGLPIESRFFGSRPEDAAGGAGRAADIIMASEVLEHVPDPADFLAMLRRGLAKDGVLVLTTPDRRQLRREAPLATLVPVLSVGAHLVLQTPDSLAGLLRRAGFTQIDMGVNGGQIVATASAGTLVLEQDDRVLRRRYRAYLTARAETVTRGNALWWGFQGRAYQEAVADSDSAEAARLWATLRPACRARFGFDPEHAAEVPPAAAGPGLRAMLRMARRSPGALPRQLLARLLGLLPRHRSGWYDLARLAAHVPKALPGILYARALDRLHGGAALVETAGLMRTAAQAADNLNNALLQLGSVDLAALSVRRAALATLAALAADHGAADCLEALGMAVAADPEARLSLARRSFIGLVNAGAMAQAAALRTRWELSEDLVDPERMQTQERDLLFCLGMLALHAQGAETLAIDRFRAARRACPPRDLWWAALRGECVAIDRLGRFDETTCLLREAESQDMPHDLRERLIN